LPQGSVNAGGILADLLSRCPHIADGDRTAMSFLSSILNRYDGTALGIRTDDAEFGPLTCINGTIRMNEGKPVITLNIRFGISSTPEALKKALSKAFSANGWTVRFRGGEAAHLLPADDPYVRACMEVYRTYTGDHSAASRLNAGGTYAIHLPRAAEIGPMLWRPVPFPLPAGHGQVHQPDECISIDGMLDAIELTMLMLLACGETEE
jgi:succinyl-diaminopimelate desuccinylase